MRAVALGIFFILSAIASLIAGLRSRYRVRKMMEEEIPEGRQCAIDSRGVRQFFSQTQVLRASVEDVLLNPSGDLSMVDGGEDLRAIDLDRLLGEWFDLFTTKLDDDDRLALEGHGVTKDRMTTAVALIRGESKNFQRFVQELEDLENRMATPTVATAYR